MKIEREKLQTILSLEIESAKKTGKTFTLLFTDLDNFKHINNTLGHKVGDIVLEKTMFKIKSIVGESIVLRTGGDEFAILIKDVSTPVKIKEISQKMIYSMRDAMEIVDTTLFVSTSIGIAIYPKDARSTDDLIQCADIALYKAKQKGRDNCQFYEESAARKIKERVKIEEELHQALKNEELRVYYQPQYDGRDHTIVGMEALVRWIHPIKGMIPPDKFIPIAEKSDLIIKIDDYVMNKAIEQFLLWDKEGLKPGSLSLNLAMRRLNNCQFMEKLQTILKTTGFNPKRLELEMLEREVMEDPEASIQKLYEISQLGIGIAIDDFGTGYSSLSYLKKLPISKLKIDKSFIKEIPYSEDDMAICRAIIALAQSLNLKIIAEGVEEKAQLKFLLDNACNTIQGYYFSKPIKGEEMTKLFLNTDDEIQMQEKLHQNDYVEYAKEILTKDRYANREIRIEQENGEFIWVQEKVIPKLDKENRVVSEVVVRYDITIRKSLEMLATTDALTLLNNRRNFDNIIVREIGNAKRNKAKLAFMMIDIDDFKKYNDSYGHQAGDAILVAVSASMTLHLKRGTDFAFRLGGEEFGILFYTPNTQFALEFANRVCQSVDALNLEHSAATTSDNVTISAGLLVVDFAQEYIDQQGFYTMADDALYEAKESGKNRVILYANDEIDFFD